MTYGSINDFETEKMKIKPKDPSNLPISSKVIKYNCKQSIQYSEKYLILPYAGTFLWANEFSESY